MIVVLKSVLLQYFYFLLVSLYCLSFFHSWFFDMLSCLQVSLVILDYQIVYVRLWIVLSFSGEDRLLLLVSI